MQAVAILSVPRLECSLAFQDWNGSGSGHYSHWNQINVEGQNVATIRVIPWAIIEVKPGALGHKRET